MLKKILLNSLSFFLYHFSYAESVKKINISGNDRVSNQTIILFSTINLNDKLDNLSLNQVIKNLYETNYFEDVKITFIDGDLNIIVKENPIIQNAYINGVKNKSLLDELKKITRKSEKYPFIRNNILDQKSILLNIVQQTGFYFADIDVEIEDASNNSVNVFYNFLETKFLITIN